VNIEGEHTFSGPRDTVWELVRDPNVLASCIPGAQSMEQVSENEYEGRMNVRVGPVAGVFAGRLVVSNEVRPESFTLSVEGRGAPGFVKGSGNVLLSPVDEDTTLMKYDGELQVGGKLAGVGQRLLDSVGKSIIRQGLESMDQQLHARLAPEPEPALTTAGEEAVPAAAAPLPQTGRPPSELEFAATVAKDVVKDYAADIFSPETQATWLAVAAALIGVIVGFWLGRKCDRS
jgi:carbon monoxide dehydrogenase subunit G